MTDVFGPLDATRWLLSLVGGRATLLLLVTAAILLALRRASASTRHAVLALAAASLLALPALRVAMPRWEVALLRAEVVQRPQATRLRVARDHEAAGCSATRTEPKASGRAAPEGCGVQPRAFGRHGRGPRLLGNAGPALAALSGSSSPGPWEPPPPSRSSPSRISS